MGRLNRGGGGMRWGLQDVARALSQRTDEELQKLNGETLKWGEKCKENILCDCYSTAGDRGQTSRQYMSDGKSFLMHFFCFLKMTFIKHKQAFRE